MPSSVLDLFRVLPFSPFVLVYEARLSAELLPFFSACAHIKHLSNIHTLRIAFHFGSTAIQISLEFHHELG